jgi:EmrB/QacA subfamily drug resistance transporter
MTTLAAPASPGAVPLAGRMTPKALWALAITSVAAFMVTLDNLVVTTAIPVIRQDLHAGLSGLQWTVNAYTLTFAVLLLTGAALGDRFGRRRLLAIGVAIFTAASAGAALAPSIAALDVARALQGVGGAIVLPLTLTVLSSAVPPARRGVALGIWGAISGLAVALGPLVGGAIVSGISWHWIFWLNVPIGLALIPLVLTRIPESRGPNVGVDLVGLALVSGGMLGVVWALVRGNSAGWANAEVLASLIGGLALLGAFVGWELRARAPMLPMHFFRSRAFSAGNAAIFGAVGSLFCAVFFMSQFLQAGLGYGPLGAGLRLLPWTATLFFVAPVAGKLVDRIGERPFLVAGPLLQAVGMAWIALIANTGMDYTQMIAPLIIAGVGISMSFPASQNSVVGSVPPEAIGKASGTTSTMRQLGGVVGIALGVAAFATTGSYASPTQFSTGFVAAMAVASGLSLLAAVAGATLPARTATRPLTPVTDGGRPAL